MVSIETIHRDNLQFGYVITLFDLLVSCAWEAQFNVIIIVIISRSTVCTPLCSRPPLRDLGLATLQLVLII